MNRTHKIAESRQITAQANAEAVGTTRQGQAYGHYSDGRLPPPDHIHSRAKRYAVKLFLSHYHEIGYTLEFGIEPPNPYPIGVLGHAHTRYRHQRIKSRERLFA